MSTVLVLTPLKDAARFVPGYFERLERLSYPKARLSVALLESDSTDDTPEVVAREAALRVGQFARLELHRRDFGYRLPAGVPRWAPNVQLVRRSVLARSRNHLLSRALRDEDWVLWLDADVIEFPEDVIERLLAVGRSIVHPHCVLDPGGPSFDRNAWRDQGRLHLDDLRSEGELVRLDAVGGSMLLVRADIHRDGLVFPPFPYGAGNPRTREGKGEIETEGLGILAHDMGHIPWGLPHLEIRHYRG